MTRDVADKPHSSVPLSNPLHTLPHLSLHPFPLSPLSLSAAAIQFLPSFHHHKAPHKDGVNDRNNGA